MKLVVRPHKEKQMDNGPSNRTMIVEYLNRCLKSDPKLMQALIKQHPVNNFSDENPIVCSANQITGVVEASAIGLLNGALLFIGEKPVYAIYDDTNPADLKLLRFEE